MEAVPGAAARQHIRSMRVLPVENVGTHWVNHPSSADSQVRRTLPVLAESDLFPPVPKEDESSHQMVATHQVQVSDRSDVTSRSYCRIAVEPNKDYLPRSSFGEVPYGRRLGVGTGECIAASDAWRRLTVSESKRVVLALVVDRAIVGPIPKCMSTDGAIETEQHDIADTRTLDVNAVVEAFSDQTVKLVAEVIPLRWSIKFDTKVGCTIGRISVAIDEKAVEPIVTTLHNLDRRKGVGRGAHTNWETEVTAEEVVLVAVLYHERSYRRCDDNVRKIAAPRVRSGTRRSSLSRHRAPEMQPDARLLLKSFDDYVSQPPLLHLYELNPNAGSCRQQRPAY